MGRNVPISAAQFNYFKVFGCEPYLQFDQFGLTSNAIGMRLAADALCINPIFGRVLIIYKGDRDE